jgi:hypothetical protein
VNLEDKLECHNPAIENQEAIFGELFRLDWFDHHTTRRAPLRFLDPPPTLVIDCDCILSVLTYRLHLDNQSLLVLPNHLPYVLAHVWEVDFLGSGLPTPRITQSSES